MKSKRSPSHSPQSQGGESSSGSAVVEQPQGNAAAQGNVSAAETSATPTLDRAGAAQAPATPVHNGDGAPGDGDELAVGGHALQAAGEGEELSEEEIAAETEQARQTGESAPDPVIEGEGEPELDAEGEVPEAAEAEASADVSAEVADLCAEVQGPSDLPAAFQDLKDGPLGGWDDEIAWHQHFAGGELNDLDLDRRALVLDALAGGIGEGVVSGARSFAIGTAMSLGASKIPHLSGFVEIAKIAYDPAAWFEGVAQNTFGKGAEGLSQLLNGESVVDRLEGLLNILDGLNGVVSTLSTICYIVAAAGFLLSFIMPACLPFVALCAKWGKMLGAISALVGVFITLGRGVLVGLRAFEILYGDADPETTLAQTESLRHQTSQFTSDFTSNSLASARDRATGAIAAHRRGEAGEGSPRQDTSTADPPSRLERAVQIASIATGNLGGKGEIGTEVLSTARTEVAETRSTTEAYRGTGAFTTDESRTTGQRLMDMESVGAEVFWGDRHRDTVTNKLEAEGQGAGSMTTPQARLAQQQALDAQRRAAAEEFERAEAARGQAQAQLDDAQSALEASQQRLAQVERDNGEVLPALRAEAQEYQALRQSYAADVEATRQQLQASHSAEQAARAQVEANPSDPAAHQALRDAQANVQAARASHDDARDGLADATRLAQGAQAEVSRREGQEAAARTQVGSAEQAVSDGTAAEQAAAGEHVASIRSHNDANMESRLWEHSDSGGRALQHHDGLTQAQPKSPTPWWLQLDKGGKLGGFATKVYENATGTKVGESATQALQGAMGVMDLSSGAPQEASGAPAMGLWAKTPIPFTSHEGADLDLRGNHSGRGEGKDYPSLVSQRLEATREALLAIPPPLCAPDRDEGSVAAMEEVDAEVAHIEHHQEVNEGLMEQGEVELQALEGLDTLREANQEAIDAHEDELEARHDGQERLEAQAEETQRESDSGAQQGQEGSGKLGDFVSGFMRLMGMVPRRLVRNPDGGGASQVADAMSDQTEASSGASDTAAAAQGDAQAMQAETEAAQSEVTGIDAEYDAVGEQIAGQEAEAEEGVGILEEAEAQSQADIADLQGERARLAARHDDAVAEMVGWVDLHGNTRRTMLGDLDGVVLLATAQQEEQEG